MDYNSLPGWRWSRIKLLIDGSPTKLRAHVDQDTTLRGFERAIHAAVLEPATWQREYQCWTGSKTRGSKVFEAFQEANPGVCYLLPSEWDQVVTIAAAIRAHPVAGPIVTGRGAREKVLEWIDPETGLALKARLDLVEASKDPVKIWDLKHCGKNASERSIRMLARKNHWIGQLAHYRAGVRSKTDAPIQCGLICFEDVAPYDLDVVIIDEKDIDEADEERKELLRTIAECERTGDWPGRCTEIHTLSMAWDEETTFEIIEEG